LVSVDRYKVLDIPAPCLFLILMSSSYVKFNVMYASPVLLLRLPPPRRRVNQGKFAPVGRGRPEAAVF
jgi:hypothetical protein